MSEAVAVTTETSTATTPPTTETTTDPTKVVQATPDPNEELQKKIGPKFAALAKKERQIMRARQQQQQMHKQMEQRQQALSQREQSLELAKTNPIEALKLMGWTYDQITNFVLNDQKLTPDRQMAELRKEVETLKQKQEREKLETLQYQQQLAQQESKEVINTFKERLNEHLASQKDKYELVNLYEEQDLVYEIIEQHFNNTGKIMNMDEAARLAEEDIETKFDQGLKTNKISTKYKLTPPKADETVKTKGAREQTTLSNNMQNTGAVSMLPAHTEQERIKRALAKLAGE